MIKITKGYAYLLGWLISFLIYLIGQAFFFINTVKAKGFICDVSTRRSSGTRYGGRVYIFYGCFVTPTGEEIKVKLGSNLSYEMGDSIGIIYKKHHPSVARADSFKSLWLVPGLYYLIPWAIIMALLTGAYYGTKYIVIAKKPWKVWLSNE